MLNSFEKKKFLSRLSSGDKLIKKQAIQYFAFNQDARCIKPLRTILQSADNEKIIRWASYALALNRDHMSKELFDEKIKELDNPESQAVEWLKISREMISRTDGIVHISDLLDSTCVDDVKEGLVLSFAYKKKPEALVKRIIENPFLWNHDVRRWVSLTLGNTRHYRDSSVFIAFLSDKKFIVREWAAWALSNLNDQQSLRDLKERINDPHPRVREWIAKAIATFDTFENTYFLLNQYHNESDMLCKEGIIRSLNPNSKSVQEFLQNELEVRIKDGPILLILAILDKLSNCLTHHTVFDTITRLLMNHDRPDIREAIVHLALVNMKSGELSLVRKILSDSKYQIVAECIKETKYFMPEDLSDNVILYDSNGIPIDSKALQELFRTSTNVQIIDGSVVGDNSRPEVDTKKHHANEWFPPDEEKEGEPDVVTGNTPAEGEKNAGLLAKDDYVPVIVNGVSDSMKKDTVEEYREHGCSGYIILVDQRMQSVWFYDRKVDVNKEGYKLLCMLSSHETETVFNYESLERTALGGVPNPKHPKALRDKIQQTIRRQFWNREPRLRECIVILERGQGVKIAKGTTVLLLPYSTDSQDSIELDVKA